MPKETIFISSVQKEFAEIRQALAAYVREDDLLRLFFDAFLFEEVAATGDSPGKVYLKEVNNTAIYLGILGADYGFEDSEGISPTEREFDAAQENHKPCWVFIQGKQALKRHPKQLTFIEKVVFQDRIEISNPGSLPRELDISKLKEPHSSYPFNPTLANCMFLTGAIERFGTGIPEMYALSAESGLRAPDFEDNKSFLVTVWRPSASTAHDRLFINLEYMPHRLVWILDGELSRSEMMESNKF